MQISAFSEPAARDADNEDWVSASPDLIVVLDGATVRTDTGCTHGVAWYVTRLGSALRSLAVDHRVPLPAALRGAIEQTASQHSECDLTHPGTPAAALAVVRTAHGAIEYLSLGDVTVVIDAAHGLHIVSDNRVDSTAPRERDDARRHPIGSPEKHSALLLMKHAELAARNRQGGYWVAAADPDVDVQAVVGKVSVSDFRRMAVLTDGAARLVTLFKSVTWGGLLDMLDAEGPSGVIRRTRTIEQLDPQGTKWPRNKKSDDASAVYVGLA